jgi:hypothetical protein
MTAAVWVAVVAVMLSTASSIVALVLSGKNLGLAQDAYDKTEERYRADRRDARDEQLRDALITVTIAVHSYTQRLAWYGKLLKDLTAPSSGVNSDVVNEYDTEKLRPAAGEVYRAILVVEFLTSDERLINVTKLIKRTMVEQTKTVNVRKPTIPGILGAVKDLEKFRTDAGQAAADLIEVAQELLPPPPPPGGEITGH